MAADTAPDQPEPGTPAWHALVVEPIIDPDREIIDPHHHLWPASGRFPYDIGDLAADTGSGHNVIATMFMECHAAYHDDGPDHLRVIGETEFVVDSAERLLVEHPASPPIAGIVGAADLSDLENLDEVLDAHVDAAKGRFRGIRDALSSPIEPEALRIPGRYGPDKYLDENFRAGVARLGVRGFTYDTWHYHHQIPEMTALARATPGTTMVLDHFGTPLGVGMFAGKRRDIYKQWKIDIAELATCPNVVAKIGGMAMPDNGYGWDVADRPATSDELVEQQADWYHHTIDCFGPQRCMFESNFPVDRLSISYAVLFNALKKIAARYSDDEQQAMFSGTARRVYSLAA